MRVAQISAREGAGSSARATTIFVCGGGEMVVVREQGRLGTSHGRFLIVKDNELMPLNIESQSDRVVT